MTNFSLVGLDKVISLRHKVLRKGRPIESAYFQEDNGADTLHFAKLNDDEEVICCLTIIPKEYNGIDAWQLRGMATEEDWQGKGLGAELVRDTIEYIQAISSKTIIWCNARESAVGFYEKLGWKIDSELFVIDPIGPHYKMKCEL